MRAPKVNAEPPSASVTTPETEWTPEGEQTLVPGVRSISQAERLAILAERPLQSRKAQKPLDIGLFDLNARNQLDLF